MEATLRLDGLQALEPFRGACPGCGAEVLSVDVAGREVVVDVAEVIPEHGCPQCAQVAGRGHKRGDCLRCGNTGVLGEVPPLRGVAVDSVGGARAYSRAGGRVEGEALHVFHVCDLSDAV